MHRLRFWVTFIFAAALLAGVGIMLRPGGRLNSARAALAASKDHSPGHHSAPNAQGIPSTPGNKSQLDGGMTNPETWKPATEPQRKSAISSVTKQLDAFRRNDYAAAAQFQASGLKNHFPSIDAFKQMMEKSYPQFAHSRSAQFGRAIADPTGQHVLLQVVVTGKDLVTVKAAYLLILEDKIYRVESVFGGAPPPSAPTISV